MKRTVVILLSIFLCTSLFGQENRVYKSISAAMQQPDSVFILDLSKQKLTELPNEVVKFKNLKKLILTKNKIDSLPMSLKDVKNLEEISIEKNKFKLFPPVFCFMPNLKRLIICRNPIVNMPSCIGDLTNLEYIDMWETEVADIPIEIQNLKKLKEIDLRGIAYNSAFQKRLLELLPNAKVHFDLPCNCE